MRALLVLVLVVLMTPAIHGVQVVVHLVADGHLGHDADESHRDDLGACEHDCTPLSHQCRCHSAMSATTSVPWHATVATFTGSKLAPVTIDGLHDRLFEPPPLRPPIS